MSSSSKNCSSVSSSAASGMLLISARLTPSARDSCRSIDRMRRRLCFFPQLGGTRPPSIINGMQFPQNPSALSSPDSSCSGLVQSLGQIRNNVVDVLDAHAQPNHLGSYANFFLLFGRELPVRSRRRMLSFPGSLPMLRCVESQDGSNGAHLGSH